MKPRTKLEKRVTGLSSKLSAVTEVQKEWAKEHIFTHEAYRCKDELWCSECGGTWIDTSNSELGTTLLSDTTECPYCHHKLDVKISRKRKVEEDELASFILSEIKKKGECVYFHYGVGWGNNWPHCWAKNTGSDAKDRHQISELAHDNVIRAFIDKGYSVEYRSEIAAGRYVIIRG